MSGLRTGLPGPSCGGWRIPILRHPLRSRRWLTDRPAWRIRAIRATTGSPWHKCPSFFDNRLTHGECAPTSIAIRQCGMAPNSCAIPFRDRCTGTFGNHFTRRVQHTIRPVLSPGSVPIVTRSDLRIFVLRAGLFEILLFFFMAGLLLHLECVSMGKLNAIPPGDQPSYPISVTRSRECLREGVPSAAPAGVPAGSSACSSAPPHPGSPVPRKPPS